MWPSGWRTHERRWSCTEHVNQRSRVRIPSSASRFFFVFVDPPVVHQQPQRRSFNPCHPSFLSPRSVTMQSVGLRSLLHPLSSPAPSLFFQQVRTLMPRPGKTHKGAAARFVVGKGAMQKGLIFRSRAGAAHLNTKKSSSRLRRLRQRTVVSREQVPAMMRLLRR